jgi:hypothetical protein
MIIQLILLLLILTATTKNIVTITKVFKNIFIDATAVAEKAWSTIAGYFIKWQQLLILLQ